MRAMFISGLLGRKRHSQIKSRNAMTRSARRCKEQIRNADGFRASRCGCGAEFDSSWRAGLVAAVATDPKLAHGGSRSALQRMTVSGRRLATRATTEAGSP